MKFHIVSNGETLKQIAFLYGLEEEELKKENKHIRVWDNLVQGTKLKIPVIPESIDQEINEMEPFVEDYYPKLKLGEGFQGESIEKHQQSLYQKVDDENQEVINTPQPEESPQTNEGNKLQSKGITTIHESGDMLIQKTSHGPLQDQQEEDIIKTELKPPKNEKKSNDTIAELSQTDEDEEEDIAPYSHPYHQYYSYPRYVYPRYIYPVYVYPRWRQKV